MTYDVRRLAPAAARPDLLRLWSNNLDVLGDVQAKFDWSYRDAPQRPAEVFLLASGDDVVGTAGVHPRGVAIQGRQVRAALPGDLAVDRGHRTLLPALTLVREVRRWVLGGFDLVYVYPNRHSEGVFRRAGYRQLGSLTRWAVPLRYGSYLARLLKLPVLPAVAGFGIDVARFLQRVPAALAASRAFRLEWLADVDPRFDRLWEQLGGEYGVAGSRRTEFLRWRFLRHPAQSFRVAALVRRGGGQELAAYAVVERAGRVAHLRDMFGRPEDCGSLLALLLPALTLDGAEAVSFRFLGSRRITEVLERHGFERRQASSTVFFDTGAAVASQRDLLSDVEHWYLTDGDEDT